jgi:hopene-associated glycosyltransferase HpnB
MLLTLSAAAALLAWLAVLLAPWQAHRTRERLEADAAASRALSDVTVLIPARDEAAVIARTLAALRAQGEGLEAIVIDDQSSDGTAQVCARVAAETSASVLTVRVVGGGALPSGWAGKLWALEQGLALVRRPFTLLLDADIELEPATIPALRRIAEERSTVLVSVMAELHCVSLAEKLLTPAFVFFFKLLFPFALVNDSRRRTAAAAGGCMLVRTDALRAIGGFASIRGALIDDCSLAAALKRAGGTIWLGLSHSVRSVRAYRLRDFWRMVSRSAFTQLRYSTLLLVVTTLLMLVVLLAPPLVLAGAIALGRVTPSRLDAAALAAVAWLAMSAAYWPVVRFYGAKPAWAIALPLASGLFMLMTWSSALAYWRGTRATWKNRSYASIQ